MKKQKLDNQNNNQKFTLGNKIQKFNSNLLNKFLKNKNKNPKKIKKKKKNLKKY